MPNDNTDDFTTKTRVCPSCRETINVLAVKCRFCGEDVGRPKDASRELTIHDLGGETIRHAAPSGSVMKALETYRAEEGQGDAAEEGPAVSDDLPELDSKNQDLASITFDRPGSTAYQRPKSTTSDKMKLTIKVVVVLAVLILIAVKGVPTLLAYIEERNAPPPITYVNRALQILETGAYEEALDEAIKAAGVVNSVANRQILGDVVGAIKTRANELLNAEPWDEANLDEAKELMHMATVKWPADDSLMTLKIQVDREVDAYYMFVRGVAVSNDPEIKSYATIYWRDRSKDERIVKVGETFANGRFYVERIYYRAIDLKDTLRNNRRFTLEQ